MKIVIKPADDTLKDFALALRQYPALAERGYRQILMRIARSGIDTLRYTPPNVKYPIEWTSEKQRRAFFATDGFGRGIPYRRTGALAAGWRSQVRGYKRGGTLKIWNDVPYEEYVSGGRQQRFHRRTGWQASDPIIAGIADEADRELQSFAVLLLEQAILARRT